MQRVPHRWLGVALIAVGCLLVPARSGAVPFNRCAQPPAPKVDWRGCDFARRQLHGVDLTGANLAYASFAGASLYNAVLFGANLSRADLTGANLATANFTGAKLNHATLSGATVVQADFSGASLTAVASGRLAGIPSNLPVHYFVRGGLLLGPGVNLSGQSMRRLDLVHANLSRANLSGADLTRADLDHASLASTNLLGAVLTGASVRSTGFHDARLYAANKQGVTTGGLVGIPRVLPAGYALKNGYLVGPGAELFRANLTHTFLSNVNLTGADLDGANLGFSVLWGAEFSVTSVRAASFAHSSLRGANFSHEDLRVTSFSSAVLIGVRSSDVLSGRLPPGWANVAGHLVGPGANLTGDDFTSAGFGGVVLTGASLEGANVTGSILTRARLAGAHTGRLIVRGRPPALPRGWIVYRGFLLGPGATLPRAGFANARLARVDLAAAQLFGTILQNANLTFANLSRAELIGVNLQHANLAHARLGGITSSGIIGVPAALPPGWSVAAGRLVHR